MMNRMIVNGVDDRIRRDVMGHTLTTEEYGDAGGVAYVAEVLTPFSAVAAPEGNGTFLRGCPTRLRRHCICAFTF